MNTYTFILITGEPGRPQIVREDYPSEERAKERAQELYKHMSLKRVILRCQDGLEFIYGSNTQEEGQITLQELSTHLGVRPLTLRRRLRALGFARPGTRWAWSKDSPTVEVIIRAMQEIEK